MATVLFPAQLSEGQEQGEVGRCTNPSAPATQWDGEGAGEDLLT